MSSHKAENIVIIGAGVIGLQTALTLLTAPPPPFQPKPKITIIASSFPGSFSPHYTSPWAGGQWRTHATPDTPFGRDQCSWDIETYHYWNSLVASENSSTPKLRSSGSGVAKVKSRYVWDEVNEEIAPSKNAQDGALGGGLWWRHDVEDFRVLDESERPENTVYGVEWSSFCVNVPRYLMYLLEEVEKNGGRCVQLTLPNDGGFQQAIETARKAVGGNVDLFINATGLAAGALVGDENMFPTRGQTVLVEGEAKMARTRRGKGYIAYTIPRPDSGTTVLGGINDAGNWNEEVDAGLSNLILERTKVLAPELLNLKGKHTVLGRQVGFRPSRRGGPRLEFEKVGGNLVLHCYGHGGAGYQNSIGCARKAHAMIQDLKRGGTVSIKAKL